MTNPHDAGSWPIFGQQTVLGANLVADVACCLGTAPVVLQDQVCYGMSNQATVHQYRAEFLMFKVGRNRAV